jgi:hypothetical protein
MPITLRMLPVARLRHVGRWRLRRCAASAMVARKKFDVLRFPLRPYREFL